MIKKRRHFYKPGDIIQGKDSNQTAIVLEAKDPTPNHPVHILLVMYADGEEAWVFDTQVKAL